MLLASKLLNYWMSSDMLFSSFKLDTSIDTNKDAHT
jgi:hypothetical protein